MSEYWKIEILKDGTYHFQRFINDKVNESYRIVNKDEANVWAACIINGFDPARKLVLKDNPTKKQSICTCTHTQACKICAASKDVDWSIIAPAFEVKTKRD